MVAAAAWVPAAVPAALAVVRAAAMAVVAVAGPVVALQWFGPRRFRLRGVVGRFILGHFGRARGICWHPKMI